jgi:hypothetical protein
MRRRLATLVRNSSWQTFRHVVLPMILPSLIGIGAVRLHTVLGRDRALQPDDRRGQYVAADASQASPRR